MSWTKVDILSWKIFVSFSEVFDKVPKLSLTWYKSVRIAVWPMSTVIFVFHESRDQNKNRNYSMKKIQESVIW